MGVLIKSGSGLQRKRTADSGVAVEAEAISDGKVAVSGVESFSSLGLTPGMMATDVVLANRTGLGRRRP